MSFHGNTLRLPAPTPWGVAWRRLVAWVHERRRLAREREEFRGLDARALRDLGLDASEYLSYRAESALVAEATRRRVAWH